MKKCSLVIGIVLLLLTGCSALHEEQEYEITSDNKLEIWSYYEGWESVAEQFKKNYAKDIEIEVKVFANNEYVDAYLDGLSNEEGPDILILDSLQMGQFNTVDAFEDLQSEPYNIGKYQQDFDTGAWGAGLDFSDEKMIAVMMANAPKVMFYRADIMKAYGFPDEPQALAEYLVEPAHYLKMAETLKREGIYMTQWALDPLGVMMSSMPYFDKEYNFVMNSKQFVEGIELCRSFVDKGLVSYKDIWLEEGQELIRNNQMAMLYLGTWGSSQIEEWVPEQAGLWRVAELPFNTNAISNGTLMAIPSNSNNKELAWEFIEEYIFGDLMPIVRNSVPCYLPKQEIFSKAAGENAFLGGQNEQRLYSDLSRECEYVNITPLDESAFNIINQQLIRGLNAGLNSKVIMENIETQIKTQLKDQIEILKE